MEQLHILDVGVRSELVRDRGVNHHLGSKLIAAHLLTKATLKTCLNSKLSCKK